MTQNQVALRDETVPAPIQEMGQNYGLAVVEMQQVRVMMREHRTNLPTIRGLLDNGLSVVEVEHVLETRSRVKSHEEELAVSLKQIVLFQREFPSVPLDAASLTEVLLSIHERFKEQYLDQMLMQLRRLHRRHPDALPETLADMLAGESDCGGARERGVGIAR